MKKYFAKIKVIVVTMEYVYDELETDHNTACKYMDCIKNESTPNNTFFTAWTHNTR